MDFEFICIDSKCLVSFFIIGQYLIEKISSGEKSPSDFSLTFVWNRSKEPLNSFRKSFPDKVIDSLDELKNPSFQYVISIKIKTTQLIE